MDETVFSAARALLTKNNIQVVDFTTFLELYVHYSEIIAHKVSKRKQNKFYQPIWVPGPGGIWFEVFVVIVSMIFA